MIETTERMDAVRIWRNGRVPVVFKPEDKGRLMVRLPRAADRADWFAGLCRLVWRISRYSAWELPRGCFEGVVRRALAQYGSVYLIQAFRRMRKCAPACWNAEGPDCECSCMGENHGSHRALEHVVSETFAFEWEGKQLACRLLTKRTALKEEASLC
jgi:hypothetical protein